MRASTAIGTVSMALLAGCSGSWVADPPGQDGGSAPAANAPNPGAPSTPGAATPPTARELFDVNVLPMLGACGACHATGASAGAPLFLASDPKADYPNLVGNPKFVNNKPPESVLVTHRHQPGKGIDFDGTQAKYVMDWLQLENTERVLPDPPVAAGNPTAMQLAAFARCMTQTDYDASGMKDLQNQETAGNAGQCHSCHQTGLYVYLSRDPTQNLSRLRVAPTLLKFVSAEQNVDGSFKDVVQARRFQDRGQQSGHPGYTLTTARAAALDQFFERTYTKWKAGTCP